MDAGGLLASFTTGLELFKTAFLVSGTERHRALEITLYLKHFNDRLISFTQFPVIFSIGNAVDGVTFLSSLGGLNGYLCVI